MDELGREWVMGTMGARWEWREQEQGGDRNTEKQKGTGVGWRHTKAEWDGESGAGQAHRDTGSRSLCRRTVGMGLWTGTPGSGWRQWEAQA